jgi:hypothetical protein
MKSITLEALIRQAFKGRGAACYARRTGLVPADDNATAALTQAARRPAEDITMKTTEFIRDLLRNDHRGRRQHRFMESADINAAFREFFMPLRAYMRRGMQTDGQVYAVEMDTCIPGVLLATDWLPLAVRGIEDPAAIADPARRRALFDKLLSEQRPDTLFAYVGERVDGNGAPVLYLEIVSADATYGAEYPIRPGQGWHRRDLLEVPHRRLDPVALA